MGVSCGYCKIFKTILKNICEGLLLDCFNVHCYIGLKVQGLYFMSVRLQGPTFLFLILHLWSWTESQPAIENLRQNFW